MASGAAASMERLQAPVSGPAWIATVCGFGLLLACVPRLLVSASPIYPDASLYLHAGMTGEPHFHLAFRYVAVIPMALAGLVTRDPFLASQLQGIVVAALGVGVMAFAATALRLTLAEALCLMILHAADPDAITLSGWTSLTDPTFGIAVLFSVCAFGRWRSGGHPAWVAAATVALLGTRITGAFVLLGFALTRPWQARDARACMHAMGWAAGAALAYALVVGLWLAGDSLWLVKAAIELRDFTLGELIKRRDKQLTNLAAMWLSPRVAALTALACYAAWKPPGAAHRNLLWTAAFVVLGMDVFDAMSDNLAVRPRRFVSVLIPLLPAAVVALRKAVGTISALVLTLSVYAIACVVSASVELASIHLPYLLDSADVRDKSKWMLVGLLSSGLLAISARRSGVFAIAAVAAIALGTTATLHEAGSLHRSYEPQVNNIATQAGSCPLAVVQPRRPYAEMLGFLNHMLNGECARTRLIDTYADLARPPLAAPIVFSQFKSHPGYRSRLVARRWGFYRHDRVDGARTLEHP